MGYPGPAEEARSTVASRLLVLIAASKIACDIVLELKLHLDRSLFNKGNGRDLTGYQLINIMRPSASIPTFAVPWLLSKPKPREREPEWSIRHPSENNIVLDYRPRASTTGRQPPLVNRRSSVNRLVNR